MRNNYKPVHHVQLKQSNIINKEINSQTFQWRSISRELGGRNHVMYYLVTSDATYQTLRGRNKSIIQFASGQGNIGRSEAEPNIILYGRNQLRVRQGQVHKCFIIPKDPSSNKLVVWKKLVSIELALCLLQHLEYPCPNLNRLSKLLIIFTAK